MHVPLIVSQVVKLPNPAQSPSTVHEVATPLLKGLPKTRGGLRTPVSKKRLSWQVPHATRVGSFFQLSSAWHFTQSRSLLGKSGNLTLVKSASVVSAPRPYSGWA